METPKRARDVQRMFRACCTSQLEALEQCVIIFEDEKAEEVWRQYMPSNCVAQAVGNMQTPSPKQSKRRPAHVQGTLHISPRGS